MCFKAPPEEGVCLILDTNYQPVSGRGARNLDPIDSPSVTGHPLKDQHRKSSRHGVTEMLHSQRAVSADLDSAMFQSALIGVAQLAAGINLGPEDEANDEVHGGEEISDELPPIPSSLAEATAGLVTLELAQQPVSDDVGSQVALPVVAAEDGPIPLSSAVKNLVLESSLKAEQITRQLAITADRADTNDAIIASQQREMAQLRASLEAREESLQVGDI